MMGLADFEGVVLFCVIASLFARPAGGCSCRNLRRWLGFFSPVSFAARSFCAFSRSSNHSASDGGECPEFC